MVTIRIINLFEIKNVVREFFPEAAVNTDKFKAYIGIVSHDSLLMTIYVEGDNLIVQEEIPNYKHDAVVRDEACDIFMKMCQKIAKEFPHDFKEIKFLQTLKHETKNNNKKL